MKIFAVDLLPWFLTHCSNTLVINIGLYVLAARDIFDKLKNPENSHLSVYIGFYEIYQGQLHDLLNERKKLHAREDGKSSVVISGLREYEIVNVEGLMQVFEYGNNARSTGTNLQKRATLYEKRLSYDRRIECLITTTLIFFLWCL